MRLRCLRGQTAPLLAALFFCATGTAWAVQGAVQGAVPLDTKQSELKEVRSRIDALNAELTRAEASRNETADQLRETEVAISVAGRRLHELASERQDVSTELTALDNQIKALDNNTASEQQQLARLLNRQFVGGESDALSLLLAGKDPNQAARDRYFLTRLSHAKANLTRQLKGVAEQKRTLREQVQQREAQLAEIESTRKDEHEQLLKEQKRRSTLLAGIAGKIASQRKEIGALKRDEQRLGNLIDGLSRIGMRSKSSVKASRGTEPKVSAGGTAKAQAKTASASNKDPGRVAGVFGSLRGHLPMPVSGRVTGRFGSPRGEEAGGVWRGLFIKAAAGAEVRSIAAGTVVFSDWLRGFGNLLIVDHGDDFLSIYAYNESLLKQAGQKTSAGEALAMVGNSGGSADSGLYFELRHQGQAFDPSAWLRP